MTSTLEVADKPTPESSPKLQERHPHHQHHHHHHLTKMTGKGNDATGKRVVIGVDGSLHSNFACDCKYLVAMA